MLESIKDRIGIGGYSAKDHLAQDILSGMIAGYIGTLVIGKTIGWLGKLQPKKDVEKEQLLITEPSNKVLADRVANTLFGEKFSEENRQTLAKGIHYGYGIFWGGVYGALHRRVPFLSRFGSVPFGLAFGLVGNEVMTTVFRLVPPPQRFPVSTHVKTLASHVTYALAADGAYRLAHRVVDRAADRLAA